jgi:hypothetical protein
MKHRSDREKGPVVRLYNLVDGADFWLVSIKPDLTAKVVAFHYGDECIEGDPSARCRAALKRRGWRVSKATPDRLVDDFFTGLRADDPSGRWMAYRGEKYDCEGELLKVALKNGAVVRALLANRPLPTSERRSG